MELLKKISDSLMEGDAESVGALTAEALAAGADARAVLDGGLIAGMNVIGERFRKHEIFLPDVLLAAKAMYTGLGKLKPLLAKGGVSAQGKVVIGSVKGDLHDIGKNLVGIMLEGVGFEVIDLGTDVAPERFVDEAVSRGAGIIGMSALLTTTMPVMRDVTALLKERGLLGKIRVVIGGAPVSDAYCREIGADAYCFDAANSVETVKKLLGK
ncbi:MAG TPA: corrinoid protein [Spirochaetota bacterium]|nr:corrinoid protein [Spirochaetota bacterium]